MAGDLDEGFAKDQKVLIKRAMKGRPLYFGLQAKAAKSGKLVLSKRPGDVKANALKELAPYQGKDADKKNEIPGGASMGVATGENGVLTLHFERGKVVPAAASFVKYFISRELKVKSVKKVVIVEADQLPAVPDKMDADDAKATPESVRQRVTDLLKRMQAIGAGKLEDGLKKCLTLSATDADKADDALDDIEFAISVHERISRLKLLLGQTAAQPGVAAEIVDSIREKRLDVAATQVDQGQVDEADDNLDIAEQSILNLSKSADHPAVQPSVSTTGAPPETVSKTQPESGLSPDQLQLGRKDLRSLAEQYTQRVDKLTPGLKQCLKQQIGDVSKIRSVFQYAQEKSGTGDWGKAFTALDALERLILESGAGGQDAAALQKQWKRAVNDAGSQLRLWQSACRFIARKTAVPEMAAGFMEVHDKLQVPIQRLESAKVEDKAEIAAYLRTDATIDAAHKYAPSMGLKFDVRTPLLDLIGRP